MKFTISYILCFFSFNVLAQIIELDVRNVLSVPCPNDPSVTVLKYENWDIYQTVNDRWDGERTEDYCLSLIDPNPNDNFDRYHVDLQSIDPERALFIATDEGITSENIEKNGAFNITIGYEIFASNTTLVTGLDNEDVMNSGIYIFTEHHGPLYSDTLFCASRFPTEEQDRAIMQTCFTTEKTEFNIITKVIYKATFNELTESTLFPYGLYFDHFWTNPNAAIDEEVLYVEEEYYDGSAYNLSLRELTNGYDNLVLVHNQDGLPAEDNQSFTEVTPSSNKAEPTTINIDFEFTTLSYQKYTYLIGGLVEGEDSLRHPLNIILSDEYLCLFSVELISGGGTSMIISGDGGIDFSDAQACLQFRDNGSLIIDEGKSTTIGKNGIGNLNLRSGGSIVLRKNSEMIFDGRMILTPYRPYKKKEDIFIDLKAGSHFVFTDKVKIDNNVFGDELFLYVHMKGGTIDLSQLDAEERSKIILVYPEQDQQEDKVVIFPNPMCEQFTVYTATDTKIMGVKLYDSQGRVVYDQPAPQVSSNVSFDPGPLASGLYIAQVQLENEVVVRPVVVN